MGHRQQLKRLDDIEERWRPTSRKQLGERREILANYEG